jgi:hypothetical protein
VVALVMFLAAHFDFYRQTVWMVLNPIGAGLAIWVFAIEVRRWWGREPD